MKGIAVTEFEAGEPPRTVRILPDPTGTLRFTVMLLAPTGHRAVGVVGYEDNGQRGGWYFEQHGQRIGDGYSGRAQCVRQSLNRLQAGNARALRAAQDKLFGNGQPTGFRPFGDGGAS